jgi:hypothetical protein
MGDDSHILKTKNTGSTLDRMSCPEYGVELLLIGTGVSQRNKNPLHLDQMFRTFLEKNLIESLEINAARILFGMIHAVILETSM